MYSARRVFYDSLELRFKPRHTNALNRYIAYSEISFVVNRMDIIFGICGHIFLSDRI